MTLRSGAPSEAGMLPERVDLARTRCAQWVESGHTPAVAICVARRGVIVLHEGFGLSSIGDAPTPIEPDSIWGVMSVSKPITAALVMQLVDDGLVGLNRPAVEYLPEISGEGVEDILLHHLLTHTSGYPWHTDPGMLSHAGKKLKAGFEPGPCPDRLHPEIHRILELFWDAPRYHSAGESMTYANHNYMLLGELVSRARGLPFEDVARRYLFEPLGMQDSHFSLPEAKSQRYVLRPTGFPLADPVPGMLDGLNSPRHQAIPNPGGGLCTTARDLVAFGQMILDGGRSGAARVLSPASVAAMSCDQIPGLEANFAGHRISPASWSYGFSIGSTLKLRFFRGSLSAMGSLGHPGAAGTGFWIDPARELTGCYIEACRTMSENLEFLTNYDLFENLINSAIEDLP